LKSVFRTRLSAALIAPALLGAMVACDTATDPGPPAGVVFVLNSAPSFTSAQLRVNQTPAGNPINFWGVDQYQVTEDPTGPHTFSLRNGSDTTSIATQIVNVHRDSVYLFVATQHEGGGSLLLYKNNIPAFDTTMASVRIVNAAQAIGTVGVVPVGAPIDVYVLGPTADINTATPNSTNIAYESASPRFTFTPPTGSSDSVRVVVTLTGSKTALVTRKYGVARVQGDMFRGSVATIVLLNNRNNKALPAELFTVTGL